MPDSMTLALNLPNDFNAAAYFIDRHLRGGRSHKVAIECGERRVTYAQLEERVNRLGNALLELDVRPEERVFLLLLDTPEFAYSFFGAIKIGAVAVPVNTALKPDDYTYLLNDCRARVAIVHEELLPLIHRIPADRLRYLQHIIVVGEAPGGMHSFSHLLHNSSPQLDPAPTCIDDPAFWLYSSGSTGPPKGCVHLQHDMVVTSELYAKGILGMTADDRCFSVAKLFFAYGLGNGLYFSLAVGGASILLPDRPRPAEVFAVIERHRPTLFFSVPTNYAALLTHYREGGPEFDLSSVRYGVSAGEALPASIFQRFQQRFGVEILDAIGSTEALHMFIANRPGAVRPGSSGQIIPGCEARLVDGEGHAVPTGDIGDLLIQSDAVCSGYWNQHEKTKATIQGHWLHTGDKYYQDEDGYFWYAGRSDDMLKVNGLWVSPIEIENALIEHPAVKEAAVVGREDQDQLLKPAAYIVLNNGTAASPDLARRLQDHVAARLASHKRPRWVEFLPELPKTATGKVQRFKLRQAQAILPEGAV
jgi:benzoate-CoA ligase family protein